MVEISGHGTIMIDGYPVENYAVVVLARYFVKSRATLLPRFDPWFGKTHEQSQEGKASLT